MKKLSAISHGKSIGNAMNAVGFHTVPVPAGPGSRKSGWEHMRRMLVAAKQQPMEEPGLFVFDTCRQFIRTVPMLPRDPHKPDDVDTASEDHIGDETRYALTHKRRTGRVEKFTGA